MAAAARKSYRQKAREAAQPYYASASPMLLAETPAFVNDNSAPNKFKDWDTVVYDNCEQTMASLLTWRTSVWTTWGQIARYEAPWRFYPFITGNMYNEGLRRDHRILDRSASEYGEICAAGLMSALTDPDRNWLKLGPGQPGVELDKQGSAYYEDLTERLNYIYDHSNFYESQAQHYTDLVFYGTAPVIDYESAETILQCFTPCPGEYYLAVGMNNTDEVFGRDFRQTIRQTVEMFGIENCSPDIQQMWREKKGDLDYENVIGHLIEPNYELGQNGGVGKVPGGFAWREIYWVRGKKDPQPLSVTGFHGSECPFGVSRWDLQGNSAYGRGIGEKLLPDCISTQLATRQQAESIERVNNPPMGADVSLQNQPSSTNPGKITYMNAANGEKKFWALYQTNPDIPAITAYIEALHERMSRTAFNHVFQPVTDLRERMKEQVTAAEVDKLSEEQLVPLGPVIGRIYGTLRKRVPRHLAIMQRKGLLPKKPQSLKGIPLKIEFVSMLTEARRATATASIARTAQFVGSLVGAWPEARFALDPEKMAREFGDGVGATTKIFRSPREIKQMVMAENQQKQAANAAAMSKEGAMAASALSKTSLAPGNALSALVGPQQ